MYSHAAVPCCCGCCCYSMSAVCQATIDLCQPPSHAVADVGGAAFDQLVARCLMNIQLHTWLIAPQMFNMYGGSSATMCELTG